MNVEVELPDLGDDGGDRATICEWRFDEGDFVEKDEHLVEVMAGDETIDIPSPASGVLAEQTVEEGDLVRIGDVIAILEVPDEGEIAEEAEEV